MIVKNESHIIRDTLDNILKNVPITYWVISDTGSTDDTKNIITQFFKERAISGELIDNEWVDFGKNRTLALEAAYNKTDYLLIFDADDRFHGNFVLPNLNSDKKDKYDMKMDGGNYYRPLLINNRRKWKFTGVLHEYLEKSEIFNETVGVIQGDYHIQSGRFGARSKDPQKYKKDAEVLKNAYEKAVKENDPVRNRYVFYCANSYKDAGMLYEAIEWYKKTLTHTGWIQERYVSCLRIFECYEKLGQRDTGFFYLVKSFEYDRERLECFNKLITHYCCENMDEIAYSYYSLIQDYYENVYFNSNPSSKLFVDISIGDFYLPYILIIVSERVKKHHIGVKMYEMIFKKKFRAPEWHLKNLIYNMRFFVDKFTQSTHRLLREYRDSYELFEKLCEDSVNNKK